MGILLTALGIGLIILVHEFGHWAVGQKFGFATPIFSIGFGSRYIVLGHWRNTEFRLSSILLGGYVSLPDMYDETTALKYMKEFDPQGKMQYKYCHHLVSIAGVVMNVIFALVVSFFAFLLIGIPVADKSQPSGALVAAVVPKSLADNAGLKVGDIVLSVEDKVITSPEELIKILPLYKGRATNLLIKRDNQEIHLVVTPNDKGKIGCASGEIYVYERQGIVKAARATIANNFKLAGLIFVSVGKLFASANLSQMAGPIGIVQFGSANYQAGMFAFLSFLSLLSINLAVLNILPIPVLDGGYVMFLALEKLRGKPLPTKVELLMKTVFMGFLLMLTIYVCVQDLLRIFNS